MSHTPGPWTVRPSNRTFLIDSVSDNSLAEVRMGPDARLIAAAPEMLALLNAILMQDIPPSLQVQIDTLLGRIEGA